MKKVLIRIGSFILGLTLFGAKGCASNDYIYIPNDFLRQIIQPEIIDSQDEEGLPLFNGNKLFAEKGLFTKEELSLATGAVAVVGDMYDPENYATSLEGLQYMTNATTLYLETGTDIIDTRPISKMVNLETIFSYYYNCTEKSQNASSYEVRNSYFDLSNLANLKKLKSLTLLDANVLDSTVLDSLPNIGHTVVQLTGAPYLLDATSLPLSTSFDYIKYLSPVKMAKKIDNIEVFAAFVSENSTTADGLREDLESANKLEVTLNDDGYLNIHNIKNTDKEKQYLYISYDGHSSSKSLHHSVHLLVPVTWF